MPSVLAIVSKVLEQLEARAIGELDRYVSKHATLRGMPVASPA